MNLYLITNPEARTAKHTYASAVVYAENGIEAKYVHPKGKRLSQMADLDYDEFLEGSSSWCALEDVQVELLAKDVPHNDITVVVCAESTVRY